MPSPDADLVSEIVPLLVECDKHTGQWIKFSYDAARAEEFAAAVRWTITNDESPFTKRNGDRRRECYAIEWAAPTNTGWSPKGSLAPVVNANGERMGRIRFRIQRKHRRPTA